MRPAQRVLDVINETTYVADPAARRLAGVGNKYHRRLHVRAGVPDRQPGFLRRSAHRHRVRSRGARRAISFSSRARRWRARAVASSTRTTGCASLTVACCSVRRWTPTNSSASSRVASRSSPSDGARLPEFPMSAADYVTGTAELTARAWELGHRRFAYIHPESRGESILDRQRGFRAELERRGADAGTAAIMRTSDGSRPVDDWAAVRASGATVLFVENPTYALGMLPHIARDGVRVPEDLSIVALADPSRSAESDLDFTRLSPPRTQLGSEALALLSRIVDPLIEVDDADLRLTLLAAPSRPAPRSASHRFPPSRPLRSSRRPHDRRPHRHPGGRRRPRRCRRGTRCAAPGDGRPDRGVPRGSADS